MKIKKFNEFINKYINEGFLETSSEYDNDKLNEIWDFVKSVGQTLKDGWSKVKTIAKTSKDAWDKYDAKTLDIFDPKVYAKDKGSAVGLKLKSKKGESFFNFTKVMDTGEEGYWAILPGSEEDKTKMTAIAKGGGDMLCIISNMKSYKKNDNLIIRIIVKIDKNNFQIIKAEYTILDMKIG